MSLAFIDRPPSEAEVERIRLVLSTYQDYTYQDELTTPKLSRPDSRDFGRAIASVFGGTTLLRGVGGSCYVILPSDAGDKEYVLYCHMSGRGCITSGCISSFSSKHPPKVNIDMNRLGRRLQEKLDEISPISNFDLDISARELGKSFISLAHSEYGEENIARISDKIDISHSYYLVLAATKRGHYQLYQFPLTLYDANSLRWRYSNPYGWFFAENDTGRVFLWHPRHFPGPTYSFLAKEALWCSPIFELAAPDSIVDADYGILSRDKLLKKFALEELQRLIGENALEPEFQRLLQKNPWMFGSEYSTLLKIRDLVARATQDFVLKRAADNYLEIIEIKTPLNGKPLFRLDPSHESYYYIPEVSQAIGQVVKYIELIDAERYAIEIKVKELVNGVRAKIIIGRDGDEGQQNALRRMNSHFHRIEILTYDQLVRVAKQVLKYE